MTSFKNNLSKFFAVALFACMPVFAGLALSVPAAAATPDPICDASLLGIPAWYNGLAAPDESVDNAEPDSKPSCSIVSPSNSDDLTSFIWHIVLNVIDMMLVVVAYIASGFIMYGGFLWLTGGARPDMVAKGRKTILNAVIGLIIAMGAIALNNLLFKSLIP